MTLEQDTLNTVDDVAAANAAIGGKAPELPERNASGYYKETFFFRPKQVKAEDGTVTKEPARAPFITYLPYVEKLADNANNTLVALLQDAEKATKTIDYLAELCNDEIYTIAQQQVNAAIAAGTTLTADIFNYAAMDLWTLINVIKESKRGGIPKELWVEFKADIQTVLTTQFGVSINGAENVAKFLGDDKLLTVKASVPHLEKLSGYLNGWFDKTSEANQEKFLPIYKFLDDRAKLYMNSVDTFTLD
jgi:hypothetical protein